MKKAKVLSDVVLIFGMLALSVQSLIRWYDSHETGWMVSAIMCGAVFIWLVQIMHSSAQKGKRWRR